MTTQVAPATAEDMLGNSLNVDDTIVFSTSAGLRIAKITKLVLNYGGYAIRLGVEIQRANGKPSRYSIDYRRRRVLKVEVDGTKVMV
jgi:hypothetical protein